MTQPAPYRVSAVPFDELWSATWVRAGEDLHVFGHPSGPVLTVGQVGPRHVVVKPVVVPEPSGLLLVGCLVLAAMGRQRR